MIKFLPSVTPDYPASLGIRQFRLACNVTHKFADPSAWILF